MAKLRAITQPRRLRTGTPVWLARDAAPLPARGAPPARVDVAIIGGGIAGALIADAVLASGRRVAVFDRRGLVAGSTPASTALLQFEIDQPLTLLSKRLGRAAAARAWWRSAMAVEALRARVADLGLRCGMRERTSVYLAGNVLDLAGLKVEAAARSRIGLRSEFVERAALRALTGIDAKGAIVSRGAAEVDPARLTRGLWRSAMARGAEAYAPIEIADVQGERAGAVLTTSEGATIQARAVVFATGYELAERLRPRGYRVISTWALATRAQRTRLWPGGALVWQAADPYLYMRTTVDGRVVLGGEDEDFTDATRGAALLARMLAGLPDQDADVFRFD